MERTEAILSPILICHSVVSYSSVIQVILKKVLVWGCAKCLQEVHCSTRSPTAESLECLQATLQITVFPRISSKTYSQDIPRAWIKQPQICLLFSPVTRECASGCPWNFENPIGFCIWKDCIFGTGICF